MAEQHELISEDVKKVIKETFFDHLKDDVAIEVFTLAGMNDQYNDAAIQLVRSLAGITDKIKVSYHTVGDAQSLKRNVTRSPTLLIAPDKYGLRFTGAPMGEEGRSLLLAIMMASTGKSALSAEGLKKLADLREKRHVQVFVSPT
jgi:thioredoxin reductase (NADPH)